VFNESTEETRYTVSAVNVFCKITYLFIQYYIYFARWYFREFDATLVTLIQAKCVMFGCTVSVLLTPTFNMHYILHNTGEVCYVWMHCQCTPYTHFQHALNSAQYRRSVLCLDALSVYSLPPLPTCTAFCTIKAKCVMFGCTVSVLLTPTSNMH